MPHTRFDGSFSRPDAVATPWEATDLVLREAELYWLTTVRTDGRPHVTPLIGVWLDGTAYFTTGHDEQKARNLAHSPLVAMTTGSNTWAQGHDVVVEGTTARVTTEEPHPSGLYAVTPSKVLSFTKGQHAQTTYTFN